MKLRFSRRADSDLSNIYADSASGFGIRQADIYRDGLMQALQFIVENPYAVPERRGFSHPIRTHTYEAHVIAYLIDDAGINIIRVVHGRMNLRKLI